MRSIWLRNDLNNISNRLKALEAKIVQDGIVLIEAKLQVLEKRRNEREAHGAHRIHSIQVIWGVQDTYYVGNFKGIGKVYSRVFIDSYTRLQILNYILIKQLLLLLICLMIECYHGMRVNKYQCFVF